MIVREAIREDIENLAHLMTELGYPSSTEDMGRRFEEISADPSYDTFIVEQDGEVLGMVELHGALSTMHKCPGSHGCCREITTNTQLELQKPF